jgi:WS/DGAT/MGAT family acyltransferase
MYPRLVAEVTRFAHHMSDEDALMWNIEKDPVLRSTIVALAVFDRVPEWARLRRRIERGTRLIPRFRQRVQSPPLRMSPPRWTVEPGFELNFHLRRMRLPEPGTWRTLLDALQPIVTTSFDRARPLWEFTLFEGLDGPDGERAALAMKVHHSVTDGVGGMSLLTNLVDLTRDADEPWAAEPGDAGLPAAAPAEHLGAWALMRESTGHVRRRALGVARRAPVTAGRAAARGLRDPLRTVSDAVRTARSIGRTLAPATSPMSPIMCERGLGRHIDTLEVGLDELRRAAKAVDASLNDVFVAAVIGGAQRYHARHGAEPQALRMTLPINLRQSDDDPAGNKFAPARFPVPAAIDDPRERVHAIRGLVRDWRAEPALQMTSALAGVLNRLPTAATTALFGGMLKCCDFVTTNVPGAPVPVYAAGARVDALYAFAPPVGASFNVALISHCDMCCIGVVIDTTAVPDHDVLMGALRAGFDEILALT